MKGFRTFFFGFYISPSINGRVDNWKLSQVVPGSLLFYFLAMARHMDLKKKNKDIEGLV